MDINVPWRLAQGKFFFGLRDNLYISGGICNGKSMIFKKAEKALRNVAGE